MVELSTCQVKSDSLNFNASLGRFDPIAPSSTPEMDQGAVPKDRGSPYPLQHKVPKRRLHPKNGLQIHWDQ